MAEHPDRVAAAAKALPNMLGYQPGFPRTPGDHGEYDHGEYIERFDKEFGEIWRARGGWKEDPETLPFLPTTDEWAEQADYVIKAVAPTMSRWASTWPAGAAAFRAMPAATRTSGPPSTASPRRRT